MSENFISLPENVYCHLLTVAETQGVTPAEWIASHLPPDFDQQKSLATSLSGLVGSINTQVESPPPYEKTVFGETIADKQA